MNRKAVSRLGWYGVLAILVAYGLLSFNVVGSREAIYQILNLTGAACLIAEASSKKDYQPVALNVVWAAIAAIALIRLAIS